MKILKLFVIILTLLLIHGYPSFDLSQRYEGPVFSLVSDQALASDRLHPEKWYQERWCREMDGRMEVIFKDGSRCDCLTKQYAVEFDFADKWAEAVGQALLYGAHTGVPPAVVLIVEDAGRDAKYVKRLKLAIRYYRLPITVFLIGG